MHGTSTWGSDTHFLPTTAAEFGVDSPELVQFGVWVASMTNLVVKLSEPATAVRPLGGQVQVRIVRWYADDPHTAMAALQPDMTA